MLPKRYARTDSAFTDSERHLILAAETLRSGDTAPKAANAGDRADEKVSMFWRVFGGTILSITALMVITAYQSLANGLHEVRTDISRLREAGAELVKKDEFNNRTTKMWDTIQQAKDMSATLTVLTSKQATLEGQFTAAERERKEMQTTLMQLAAMRDRLSVIDDVKKLSEQDHKELQSAGTALAALRERDAALEKQVKDAETERRDVCRELLALRERLAKLEGQQEAKPATAKAPGDSIKKIDGEP